MAKASAPVVYTCNACAEKTTEVLSSVVGDLRLCNDPKACIKRAKAKGIYLAYPSPQ